MRKTLLTTALLAALPIAGTVHAEDSPFSANVSLVSDYAFRGISQNDERPAIQGGFDYAHASGAYVGVWASNVSWLSDSDPDISNSIESNLYVGYAGEAGAIGYDVGLLQYYYPGSYPKGFNSPDTLEGYIALSWQFVSFKYSHSFTDLFGFDNSKNSQYYDLSASYALMEGLTLDAHYGYQRIKGAGNDNYKDWKLGLTKTYGGFDFGLHYIDTDIKRDDLADERVVLSVSKSF
jgi:uncharacterized protein (TIGR02001 family)